mgnify:CR=1 FL=1
MSVVQNPCYSWEGLRKSPTTSADRLAFTQQTPAAAVSRNTMSAVEANKINTVLHNATATTKSYPTLIMLGDRLGNSRALGQIFT